MKKIITIALGLCLVSASAIAHHTQGLKNFQANQASGTHGSSVQVTGGSLVTPNFVIVNSRFGGRSPVVNDPISCARKWGAHCVAAPVFSVTPLDLGETATNEYLDQHGTSVNGIKWQNDKLPPSEPTSSLDLTIGDKLDLSLGDTDEIDLSLGGTSDIDLSIGATIE